MSKVSQQVKNYLNAIKSGDKQTVEQRGNQLLMEVGKVNSQKGGETGTKEAYNELSKYVDIDGFMNSLTSSQRGKIRRAVADSVGMQSGGELIGGVDDYTVLEILLSILFFPWSIIYWLFLRTPSTTPNSMNKSPQNKEKQAPANKPLQNKEKQTSQNNKKSTTISPQTKRKQAILLQNKERQTRQNSQKIAD